MLRQPSGRNVFLPIAVALLAAAAHSQEAPVTYVTSSEEFANPERGFYHHTEVHSNSLNALDANSMTSWRKNEKITLALRIWYMEDYVNSALSSSYLSLIQKDFDAARTAGIKLILRFAYTLRYPDGPYGDAPLSRVRQHILQVEPILRANSDVIAVVQAGFIGSWGEWYATDHFGMPPRDIDYRRRDSLVNAVLAALPEDRMVQIRTPGFKRILTGVTKPIDSAAAFDGSKLSRLGHHNDCLFASHNDMGTYGDTASEKAYVAQETRFLPNGGETCGDFAARTQCDIAVPEMRRLHYSYLNTDYHKTVLARWSSEGCMSQVKREMGYRYALVSGTLTTAARPGAAYRVRLQVRNDGWSSVYNPRPVDLVIRSRSNPKNVFRARLQADPRRWESGKTWTVDETVGVPAGLPVGQYDVFLHLPDPDSRLASRSPYAIRLANTGLWEDSTGLNSLSSVLSVDAAASNATPYSGKTWFAGGSLAQPAPPTTSVATDAALPTVLRFGAVPRVVGQNLVMRVESPAASRAQIAIHDMAGRQVYSQELALQPGVADVSLAARLPAGMHVLTLRTSEGLLRERLPVMR